MGACDSVKYKLKKTENEKTYINEMFIDNEKIIEGRGKLLELNNVNIIGKSTCNIAFKIHDSTIKGTGFLIKLPIPNSNKPMKGLMTNNHVLNYNVLTKDRISLIFESTKKNFDLYLKNHFIFSDPFLDITFIKLNEEELNKLEIDCLEIHEEESIPDEAFICQYSYGKHLSLAQGKIKSRWGFNLYHTINTDYGSSGAPIVLLSDNKIIGVHKCGLKDLKCNAATDIQTIVRALKVINNSVIDNKLSIIKKARTPLTKDEINELKKHGLNKTDSPYIFISPRSSNVTPLWFYRTNHAWYWTPTEPEIDNLYKSNWLIIYPGGSLKVIGGFWDGIEPANKNIKLIHWLESTGLKFLI